MLLLACQGSVGLMDGPDTTCPAVRYICIWPADNDPLRTTGKEKKETYS